ncbi:MAG: hypothetical protein VX898_00835 [Candidatus Thermoplasmatota archaeon]|jgi:hypothetical protein|nr:hypothetical protein [Candidatus Thermoplasmatota archaeon]MED6305460.1 hypothetical protein [Candidatus Thermoplasmatota archaeon]
MNQDQKNSFGMGMFVFFLWFFFMYLAEPFGPVDLIGAVGTAFGFGFGIGMANYFMKKKNE